MSRELDCAIRAAKKAGKILVKSYATRGGEKKFKSEFDFATEADHQAEEAILKILEKKFPSYSILTEEGGATERKSEYKWIIDPLDGTHNFAWGFPIWATAIALEKAGEIVAAAVSCPLQKEVYYSEKGKGVFLNKKKIRVSDRKFPHCMISIGGIGHRTSEPLIKQAVEPILDKFHHDMRILGSSVFATCSVAAGNLDAFATFNQKPWDTATGLLFVKEAGGRATDMKGEVTDAYAKNFIFSNGLVHDEILKAINSTNGS